MKKLFVFGILSLAVACGKQGGGDTSHASKGGIGQFRSLDEIKTSAFTQTEKNLGKALCDNLQYRNNNFFAQYGSTKKFKFNVNLHECGKAEEAGKSAYQYKTGNGFLSFNQVLTSGSDPVFTPVVEIDNLGSYKDFCDVRNANPNRYFGSESDFKYYVFYEGGDCTNGAICGDVSFVQNGVVTFAKKIAVIKDSGTNQFGLNLRGQEIVSETYLKCDGGVGTQLLSLDSVLNI